MQMWKVGAGRDLQTISLVEHCRGERRGIFFYLLVKIRLPHRAGCPLSGPIPHPPTGKDDDQKSINHYFDSFSFQKLLKGMDNNFWFHSQIGIFTIL